MSNSAITLSTETIHRPDEPRHFMRLRPTGRRIRVLREGSVLADSGDALRVIEVGRDVYDPKIYFPEGHVAARLKRNQKSTHCPLKGDAVYYDLVDEQDEMLCAEIAWAYPEPFDFATGLEGRIAFYPDKVTIEESPQ